VQLLNVAFSGKPLGKLLDSGGAGRSKGRLLPFHELYTRELAEVHPPFVFKDRRTAEVGV